MFDIDFKINEYYKRLRDSAEEKSRQNILTAESAPGFNELSLSLKSFMLDKSKAEYMKDFKKADLLQKQIESTNFQIGKILSGFGMTTAELEPVYECKLCRDTGLLSDGSCSCKAKYYAMFLSEELFHGRQERTTFDKAIIDQKNQSAIKFSKEYCDSFPDSITKTLVFSGKTGTGKTFLSECIVNELIDKSRNIIFFSAFELINKIKEYHYSFTKNINDVLNPLYKCELLVIDDLGCEAFIKNITEEYLVNIIDARISASKHTLFTTNLNKDEILCKYGERFFARLTTKNISAFFIFDSFNNMRKFV